MYNLLIPRNRSHVIILSKYCNSDASLLLLDPFTNFLTHCFPNVVFFSLKPTHNAKFTTNNAILANPERHMMTNRCYSNEISANPKYYSK